MREKKKRKKEEKSMELNERLLFELMSSTSLCHWSERKRENSQLVNGNKFSDKKVRENRVLELEG